MNYKNKNKKHNRYIRIFGFSNQLNNIITDATDIAEEEKCACISTIHLFLAMMQKMPIGDEIIEYLGTSFDMIYDAYRTLVETGVFGNGEFISDDNDMPVRWTEDFDYLVKISMMRLAMREQKQIDEQMMLETMISERIAELGMFLDRIGITFEEIEKLMQIDVSIPAELNGLVINLNKQMSRKPELIVGVDEYLSDMINILGRKNKANPCLIGDAGVGKTSIAKAFAQLINSKKVPDEFLNTTVMSVDCALLTSGTRFRGDFEERMQTLISWATENDVILFLDEIHTFINLGKNGDSSDTAGNMIKSALASGDLKIIGATTSAEYHQYIEKDKAFARRLQEVYVKEPSVSDSIAIIANSKSNYEEFHNIKIEDEAIKEAVELSDRYMKDKHLPDKAYTIIDQACAVKKFSKGTVVTVDDVNKTVSKITGININKLTKNESKELLSLENKIGKELISQDEAISKVCKAIRRSKAGVRDENKPLASFMFVGPTGVGKTELCRILSKEVCIGDASFIKIDMSEYAEKESISKMIGSAPGYVGYGEGGQLTEKVKHNPYSIVLFDEIEKAHPDVYNIFLQILDEGKLTDSEGNTVDFTNCIIVMTSNAGYGVDGMNKRQLGFNTESHTDIDEAYRKERIAIEALEQTFKPELLNRLDNIVVFNKLNRESCFDIVNLMLNKLKDRQAKRDIKLRFSKSIINMIVDKGFSDKYGARNLKRIIQDTVEDRLADAILREEIHNGDTVAVSYKDNNVIIKVDR